MRLRHHKPALHARAPRRKSSCWAWRARGVRLSATYGVLAQLEERLKTVLVRLGGRQLGCRATISVALTCERRVRARDPPGRRPGPSGMAAAHIPRTATKCPTPAWTQPTGPRFLILFRVLVPWYSVLEGLLTSRCYTERPVDSTPPAKGRQSNNQRGRRAVRGPSTL